MGYFQVRYDSRVVNYYRRGFIRLATGAIVVSLPENVDERFFSLWFRAPGEQAQFGKN